MTDLCVRCQEPAVAMCAECGDDLCLSHLEPVRGGLLGRIGPRMALCNPCHRERFWRLARGALALATIGIVITSLLEKMPLPAFLGVVLLGAWWWVSTKLIAVARRDLERERGLRG
jgi:hypothetical protein